MTSPDLIPDAQDDVPRNDLPDNDPGTDDIDPDTQGCDLPHLHLAQPPA